MLKRFFKCGYTLIEILVTLTILGIIFSVGYANFRDYSRKQFLESFARQLRSDVRLAQEEAIAGKKPGACNENYILDGYKVTVAPSTYTVQAVCSSLVGGPAVVVETKTISNPADISSSAAAFTFKALSSGVTSPTGLNIPITLTQNSTQKTIVLTVTLGGEIK